MAENEIVLPEPPGRPFGSREKPSTEKNPFLLADRMAMALAEGKLDEFLEKEMPGNEKARKLARMMMGLTGMVPSEGPCEDKKATETSGGNSSTVAPPEDIMKAAQEGNVQGLVDLLQRELGKQTAGPEDVKARHEKNVASAVPDEIEKEILDDLIAIAADNNLTLDWLIMRALKVYVQEYLKTGRL